MDSYFAVGLIEFMMLIVFPAFMYIYGIKFKHGMSIIVTGGSVYTLIALFTGHIMCAMVYSFFIIAYLVYKADQYVDEMKAHKFSYERFKDYVDMDFSDIEGLFTNIFGETHEINKGNRYSKEFNKYFNSNQYNQRYRNQRFSESNSSTARDNNGYYNDTSKAGTTGTAGRTGKDYSRQQDSSDINKEAVANGLRYYAKCMTVDDAKKAYRKYAVTFHPDNPVTGDADKFVEIDKQYNRFVELFGDR